MTRKRGSWARTHGQTVGGWTPEYTAWKAMRHRCYSKSWERYSDYGGRGIVVCERWRHSFENFFADMGKRPSDAHSLDRIDNGGNYEPANCRWATRAEQQRNKHSNHYVTLNGETRLLIDWCADFGLSPSCCLNRIARGWTPERALTTPSTRPFSWQRPRGSRGGPPLKNKAVPA